MTKDACGNQNFATTRWSLILLSSDLDQNDANARGALSELCRIYWRPVLGFVCKRGYSSPDAQDLTQDFFVMIMDRSWLGRANPERGRFRSLLLKSLTNFLNDASERRQARKRGGAARFVTWDDWMAEATPRLSSTPKVMESWSAERVFDHGWATTVVEQALHRLREECESQARLRVFEILKPCLGAERKEVSYSLLSERLDVPEAAVKRLVHRLRERYRAILRDEVAHTVHDPAEVDHEIRYLCEVLATGASEIAW